LICPFAFLQDVGKYKELEIGYQRMEEGSLMSNNLQIDTMSVRDLGNAIVNSAQDEQNSTDPAALDNFQRDLSNIIPTMPQILDSALTQFNTNFYKSYTDVLDQRLAIGHILLSTATAAEKQEVATVNTFTDTSPQTLIP
jgi:hypothetical protein